jgi:hypothetical protein
MVAKLQLICTWPGTAHHDAMFHHHAMCNFNVSVVCVAIACSLTQRAVFCSEQVKLGAFLGCVRLAPRLVHNDNRVSAQLRKCKDRGLALGSTTWRAGLNERVSFDFGTSEVSCGLTKADLQGVVLVRTWRSRRAPCVDSSP